MANLWRTTRSARLVGAGLVLLAACHALSPNKPDASGFTPLMRAAERDDAAEIRRLTGRGENPNYQGREVKHYSILFPFVSTEWKDVPKEAWTPLVVAAQAGHASAIRALVQGGADPNLGTRLGRVGTTPLWFAASKGHAAAVTALLDSGASISSPATYNALRAAIEGGHIDLARLMVARRAGVEVLEPIMRPDVTGWDSPLTMAIRDGHEALARELLANLDVKGDRGGTALRAAALRGDPGIVAALLARSASPDGAGLPVYATPLLLAAEGGHAAAVGHLLEAGANTEARHHHTGATALVTAARQGNPDVVDLLLRHRANLEARDAQGFTAVARAAERRAEAVLALLKAKGASMGELLSPPLVAAVKAGDVASVRSLLSRGAPADVRESHNRRTMLMVAALDGRRDVVAALVRGGATPDATDGQGQSALTLAVIGGHADIVRDLLGLGAPVPDDPRANPIPLAVARKRDDLLALLIPHAGEAARLDGLRAVARHDHPSVVKAMAKGVSVEALGDALVDAAREGRQAVASALLAAGAPANASDDRGVTALMWAARSGDAATIRALAAAGADVNARLADYRMGDARLPRSTGWTAVYWAACEERPDAVQALVELGADVDVKDSRGASALDCAADRGSFETVAILRGAGAKGVVDDAKVRMVALLRSARRGDAARVRALLALGIGARTADDFGLTPLHEAVRGGRLEVVQILIAAGANVNARHRDGHSPLWLAIQHRRKEIAEVLRGAGAVEHASGSAFR
jgi:ankyrin repeat protein